jgi:hypothetical protein
MLGQENRRIQSLNLHLEVDKSQVNQSPKANYFDLADLVVAHPDWAASRLKADQIHVQQLSPPLQPNLLRCHSLCLPQARPTMYRVNYRLLQRMQGNRRLPHLQRLQRQRIRLTARFTISTVKRRVNLA